jgi:hypothetical protein
MVVSPKSKMDIQCPCSPCGAAYVFKLFGRPEGLAGTVEQEIDLARRDESRDRNRRSGSD